jgi:transcriptional regulator with XRE-family HTH domain
MNITGTLLKELRLKSNLTLDQLAAKLNEKFDVSLTKSMLSKWETGKAVPVYDHLKRLALYYDVTTDFLLGFNHYENLIVDNSDNNSDKNKTKFHDSKKHNAVMEITELLEDDDEITTNDVLFIKDFLHFLKSRKHTNLSK